MRQVPQERLEELDRYVIYLVHGGRKSCRGIAHEYANPALIAGEKDIAAEAFSGGGMTLVDTNAILRYLLDDIPEQADAAE